MRVRRLVALLAVVVLGTGLFFAGRASETTSPRPTVRTPTYVAYTFSPISFDFPSVFRGWALGTIPCHHRSHCLSLRTTTDAGESWSVVQLPRALLHVADRKVDGTPSVMGGTLGDDDPTYLRVRFANAHDGWIFGSLAVPSHPKYGDALSYLTVLWATHDGGLVWRSLSPSSMHDQQGLLDLAAHANTVYAIAFNKSSRVVLESSPVHRNAWRVIHARGLGTPAGGGPLSGAFVFSGARGWLVEGNDRGVTGSEQLVGGDAWTPWRPPCASVGDSLTVPAAVTPSELVAECQLGGFASPLTKAAPKGARWGSTWLYESVNAGRTFWQCPVWGRSVKTPVRLTAPDPARCR